MYSLMLIMVLYILIGAMLAIIYPLRVNSLSANPRKKCTMYLYLELFAFSSIENLRLSRPVSLSLFPSPPIPPSILRVRREPSAIQWPSYMTPGDDTLNLI